MPRLREMPATTGGDDLTAKPSDLGEELEALYHEADAVFEELVSILERARSICDELEEAGVSPGLVGFVLGR